MMRASAAMIAAALSVASPIAAHSGGTNACGCHFDSSTDECHCHNGSGCGCDCEPVGCGQPDNGGRTTDNTVPLIVCGSVLGVVTLGSLCVAVTYPLWSSMSWPSASTAPASLPPSIDRSWYAEQAADIPKRDRGLVDACMPYMVLDANPAGPSEHAPASRRIAGAIAGKGITGSDLDTFVQINGCPLALVEEVRGAKPGAARQKVAVPW